jgi:TolB-like protein/Flp pilus assembly protein TadD
MSPAGDQEYFADGMTEELLNSLAKIREIRVGGRTSSFAYKGQDKDLREIGDELGVQYVVEGSVRKQDDRLRITAQLVDANDNFHLWSESYDRTIDDVFAVQEEIASAIAEELQVSLGLGEEESLVAPIGDLDAYELFLTGRTRMRERGDGVDEAVQLFEATIARDSSWAPGWAGLAQAWSLVPFYRAAESREGYWATWESSLNAAEVAAIRALEIDPQIAGAEVALGNVYRDRWDWEQGERHYLRALEIDPDDVEAHQQYAELLAATGRLDEALRSARRAVALDPTSAIRLNVLGYILWMNNRPEEAILQFELAIVHGGEFVSPFANLERAYLSVGDYDRAEAIVRDEILPRFFDTMVAAGVRVRSREELKAGYDAIRAGDRAAFDACCDPENWQIAHYVALGDTARAFDMAVESMLARPRFRADGFGRIWWAGFSRYEADPRFQEMLQHTGLEGAELKLAAPGE